MGKTVECIEQIIRAAHGIEAPSKDALDGLRTRAVEIAAQVVKQRTEGIQPARADLETIDQARRELTLAYRDVPPVIDDAIVG